jgi:FAD/FMN-containing dehydrogenase
VELARTVRHQIVYYPELPKGFSSQYYSTEQQDLVPTCVLTPESTDDISKALLLVKQHDCAFAIRGGGHGIPLGASNIHDGLVIDLREFNGIALSEDHSTVSVGSGLRWRDVYPKLEEHGLTAVGGRVGTVGVSGFLLGGKNMKE